MKYCSIVWDGENFNVPKDLGTPREDQLVSTHLDNLAELSGRTCYDSLGSGRKSTDYHAHIIEVGHGSVQEHPNLTFLIPNLNIPDYLACCETLLNRPGVFCSRVIRKPSIITVGSPSIVFDLRITTNMRAVREWFKHDSILDNDMNQLLGMTIQNLAKEKAPLLFQDIPKHDIGDHECIVVKPELDEEIWVSMFFTNVSRGFSHELVRHKYMTAVSQRSTRYVDEDKSNWCWHPLIEQYEKESSDPIDKLILKSREDDCKNTYTNIVQNLQKFLIGKGTDKFTARKQARGAARGVLGNALMTELIFSASLSQWKWMINLRASKHADGEIRLVFNEVYDLLKDLFPNRFENWTKEDCDDGIGCEIKQNK